MDPGSVVRIEEEGAVSVVAAVGCGGGTGRRRCCQRRAAAKKIQSNCSDAERAWPRQGEREEEVGADLE
jgi:hypothetical protein